MLQKSFSLLFILLAFTGFSQKMNMTKIEPVNATARVVGVLEGKSNLAVLYITKVDSANEFSLKPNTEILAKFHFTTKPTKGDPELAGIRSDDVINAEIAGKFDSISGQMTYTVFRYNVLEVITIKKTSTEASDSPRK